jgi:hypothetical protein
MQPAPKPQGDQQGPYTPAGVFDPYVFEQFEGMNTATLRPGVDDKEAAWLDGFMPLGPQRNLRTMPDVATALATFNANTVAFFDFANIGAVPVMVVFLTDGSIFLVNTNTGAKGNIAAPGTITNPSRSNVDIAGYGSQYILIIASQPNGYFIWDGATFHVPGGPAPGGGTMPTGIGGTAIEVYAGRIWIAHGPTIFFSAPGSVILFSSAGGGNFTSSDSFLRVQFIGLRQSNGFLYLVADSSVNYISGVQTSGSPATTTFTNQNLDPEVGTPWPSTIDIFNRNVIFANPFGVHIAYGGAISKVSEKLDGVYNTVTNFGSFVPSAGKAIVYGKKIWLLLLLIVDPISGQQVNKLFCWNGKIWWAASQSKNFLFIQHQEINSNMTCYGTDGTSIYALFQTPSNAFTKIAQSKLWDKPGYEWFKFAARLWGIFQYYSAVSTNLTISIDNETSTAQNSITFNPIALLMTWKNNIGGVITWKNNASATMTWSYFGKGFTVSPPDAIGQEGALIGITVQTQAQDMAIVSMKIAPIVEAYRG